MRYELGRTTRCRFEVAVRDVTPPVGIYHRSWGAAKHDVAEGIHRLMSATAAVFAPLEGGGPTLALVGVDYGWFQAPGDEAALRDEVRGRTGLGEAELLINLSHTHAGASATSRYVDRPGGDLIPGFVTKLTDAIADAVTEARANLAPAAVAWGQGRCTLAGNRDFWDAEAGAFACGFNPEGEADDTALVGRVIDTDGRTLATIMNYACHPTTLAYANRLLSPDYVGAAREVLEHAFAAPALFLQGASGELGPREGYVGNPAVADRNGRQLGHAAAAAIEGLPPPASRFAYTGIVDSGAQLGTWSYEPATPDDLHGSDRLAATLVYAELPRKELPQPEAIKRQLDVSTDGAERERLTRRLLLSEALGNQPTYRMPIWVWRLGQAALVASPNEPYSLFQRELRARYPDVPLLVLGMTNGHVGYLCPADTYGTGRYQEWQSPFGPGCLETAIETAAKGVAQVMAPTPDPSPVRGRGE